MWLYEKDGVNLAETLAGTSMDLPIAREVFDSNKRTIGVLEPHDEGDDGDEHAHDGGHHDAESR